MEHDAEGDDITDQKRRNAGQKRRAERYAGYIVAHALRGQDRHLFCSSHFRFLSDVVSRPDVAISLETDRFDYVVSCDFISAHDPTDPSARRVLTTFGSTPNVVFTDPDQLSTRILFMRGYPSADWINVLGSQYRVDIEFFRQKLGFLDGKTYYDLPAMPSNSQNILHLKISTIYAREVPLTLSQLRKLRQSEKRAVRQHQRSPSAVGASIFRQVTLVDETSFAVEQDISIYIAHKRDRGRIAIVWLDAGRELQHCGPAPWETELNSEDMVRNDPLPTVRHIPSKMLASAVPPDSLPGSDGPPPFGSQPPSTSHLAHQYGLTLDHQVASIDLSYALGELFLFAACSTTQSLNLTERRIATLLHDFHGQEELALDELNYVMRLLQDRLQHLCDIQSFLHGIGLGAIGAGNLHPLAVPDTQQQQRLPKALQAGAMLVEDFTYLHNRATSLIAQAKDGMDYVSRRVMLEESRRTISKADRMERLTLLALFFLPLSFTTSFFGSNFRELGGTGDLSIWILFATLLPALFLSMVLCFWDGLVGWSRPFRKRSIGGLIE
ncbi:hypothetical protein B0T18DRAFT_163255 [Schizothecium vesticola]|uniref:Cora-domain-containing protein n=1 Tax=Schizothecium vesticola TaxID=314040 RepID=A0AA40K5P9_9PEZI|nr:hypothetical protein B0T18DRAFT_163255 [Schizothecium vesticola]